MISLAAVCGSARASGTELTGADVTSPSLRIFTHSAVVRFRMTWVRSSSSASLFSHRVSKSVKRGSSSRSGRSIATAYLRQNDWLGQHTAIQPSAVWKFWNGVMDEWADSAVRAGWYPLVMFQVA